MFDYIILPFMLLIFYFAYYIETHLILSEAIRYRYVRWRKLNSLVSSTETKKYRVVWISIKMILQSMYISLLQYMNTSVRALDRKTYVVSYVIKGRMYKMIVTTRTGPAPILQISDDESNDVTEQVLPYMGPQYDWHGNHLNPEFFGHKTLTFELMNGTEHTYEGDAKVDYMQKN